MKLAVPYEVGFIAFSILNLSIFISMTVWRDLLFMKRKLRI